MLDDTLLEHAPFANSRNIENSLAYCVQMWLRGRATFFSSLFKFALCCRQHFYTLLLASSMLCDNSNALVNVSLFSGSSLSWICSSLIPHTSLSLIISSNEVPKLQLKFPSRALSSVTKVATDRPCCLNRQWNLYLCMILCRHCQREKCFRRSWLLWNILLVIPATNASSERTFSALRRIKTYLERPWLRLDWTI